MDGQIQERAPAAEQRPGSMPTNAPQTKRRNGDAAKPAAKPSLWARFREHWFLALAAIRLFVVALIAGLIYWLENRHYESTDDAFVAARSFSLAAKVGGWGRPRSTEPLPIKRNQEPAAPLTGLRRMD